MKTIQLRDLSKAETQNFLLHAVAPRPICFAATIDKAGNINLSPFSFFNVFSTNPPILIFSPSRRLRDNSTKHSLENILEIPEVCINIVTYEMVHQVSLSSCEYPRGTDEFIKSGFTKEPSVAIKPPRVKESPVQMECTVREVKPLGANPGAGNLVIAEVLLMHVNETVLTKEGTIDQRKLDLVARMGGNWYARVNGSNVFRVEKPNASIGIGIDSLPEAIRCSEVLTGNNLAQLANVSQMPLVDASFSDEKLKNIFQYYSISPEEMEKELHIYARELLEAGRVAEAWQVLLALN
jgi:flavin reductase (DIM6/NTAB) family NADH-FMN oxidoreductase RutF